MRDAALRAIAACRQMATMSEEPGRTTRRFLTAPMHQAHAYLEGRMRELGMSTQIDAMGNLRGRLEPRDARTPRLLIGSHIDTVPDAGAFDGVLGVALALELAAFTREFALPLPIEVVAFSEEEGVRYSLPFLGSRALAGSFDLAALDRVDAQGVTMREAIRRFGLDPEGIPSAALDDDVLGFLEMHIEQGPMLEAEGLAVAAVTAISGQSRIDLIFRGHANHAGTTPMHLRRDALAAAAEWIAAVEALGRSVESLVATVGKIGVEPNASNVVPGAAHVSLDVRHPLNAQRTAAVNELLAQAGNIAARRGLTLHTSVQMDQPTVAMDAALTAALTEAMAAAGLQRKTMPSGSGHDAMVIASRLPTAMLFLRCPGGVSHHPAETVLEDDVEAALHVGREFLLRLSQNIG